MTDKFTPELTREEQIKQTKHKFIDDHETIVFVIKKESDKDYVITTIEEPRMMIGRTTKFEAIVVAFQRYLERLNEKEIAKKSLGEDSGN